MTDARRAELTKWMRICETELLNTGADSTIVYRSVFDPPTVLALLRDLAAAEARVGMLHHLVAAARTYIDPEKYAAWDAAASAEVEPCDTLADQLIQAERERDAARTDLRIVAVQAQNTERENASLRARVAAADALSHLRFWEHVAMGYELEWGKTCFGLECRQFAQWANKDGVWCKMHYTGAAGWPGLAAFDATATDATGRMDAAVDRMKTERDAALGEMAAQINVNDSLRLEAHRLRTRVAAAERLVDVLRRHTRRDCEGAWYEAQRDALAAWDALA